MPITHQEFGGAGFNSDHVVSSNFYEDNHIIAVNKRSSDIVQGDKTGDTPLSEVVKMWLKCGGGTHSGGRR